MPESVIVWDLETIPDLSAAGRMLSLTEDQNIRDALGDGFPKLPLHKIVCIGALIGEFDGSMWHVRALGAPHIGERTEPELISGFVAKIAELRPQLVSFNGHSFDLPVLRYRAMLHELSAPGLAARPYYNRYTEDALDLCDALSSFDGRLKVKLGDLCKGLGLRGKANGPDGSHVERMVAEGLVSEVADYCECDVVCTGLAAISIVQGESLACSLRCKLCRTSFVPDAFKRKEAAPHLLLCVICIRQWDRPTLQLMRNCASPPYKIKVTKAVSLFHMGASDEIANVRRIDWTLTGTLLAAVFRSQQ
jgi:3'-5' exonuclease